MTDLTVLAAVAEALRAAGRYNRDDKVPPAAILWPDPDRAWVSLLPRLRDLLPVASLGACEENSLTGPAVWLRCLLGGAVGPDHVEGPWVVYLPGVARTELRPVESCAPELQPIAELQFRASWWQQSNGVPWTPASFLRSQEGLGLDLARDAATREALELALERLAETAVDDLRRKDRIDAAYLTSLLSTDETKTLLEWLNDPDGTRQQLGEKPWMAFVSQCRSRFGVDPQVDGELVAAERLGLREGSWDQAWQRFTEAPRSYPRIPELLRRARPSQLFFGHADSWPQENENAERSLADALAALAGATPEEARKTLAQLETEHAPRRDSVWAALGNAPLALAVGHAARVAELTKQLPGGASVNDFAAWHADHGWRVDESAVAGIAAVTAMADREAVQAALAPVYVPWLDEVARRFQDVAVTHSYRGQTGLEIKGGDCVVFVDGLRYDVGEALRKALGGRGCDATLEPRLAPFPSVTGTGKPAVAPITDPITGGSEMSAANSAGKPISGDTLRSCLRISGVEPFGASETGDPSGKGWTEAADLDKTGHNLGLKLVDRIPQEVNEIASRVQELLLSGWKRVLVVTDHGWLLMPGKPPKVDLPQHLTEVRKPRCARLTTAAQAVTHPTIPWTWDSEVRMVSPRGVAFFEGSHSYDHGGLSPQECVIPLLVVTSGMSSAAAGRIEQVKWLGMRCRIDVVDAPVGSVIDLRRNPGDATSSLAARPQPVRDELDTRLLVEDDRLEGVDAYVVLLSGRGEILAQVSTRVGG